MCVHVWLCVRRRQYYIPRGSRDVALLNRGFVLAIAHVRCVDIHSSYVWQGLLNWGFVLAILLIAHTILFLFCLFGFTGACRAQTC